MQTFMPYSSFVRSAAVLDRQRLGKQRVEAVQILNALHGGSGWANHPATRMWKWHERSLIQYLQAVCDEWVSRGYDNTKCGKHLEYWKDLYDLPDNLSPILHGVDVWWMHPHWLGDEDFHLSHRRKLQWKNPEHYAPIFGLPITTDEPVYVWP